MQGWQQCSLDRVRGCAPHHACVCMCVYVCVSLCVRTAGMFVMGEMHGPGTMTFANRDRYEGNMVNNRMHGELHVVYRLQYTAALQACSVRTLPLTFRSDMHMPMSSHAHVKNEVQRQGADTSMRGLLNLLVSLPHVHRLCHLQVQEW